MTGPMDDTISSQGAREVLDYWFIEYALGDLAKKQENRWFTGGPEIDREIGQRFGHRVELALAGGLKDWEGEPGSRLALIILLDQFTRNIFRGTPRAFAGDPRAAKLARRGQVMDIFRGLPLIQRVFALMPLEHSDSFRIRRCVLRRWLACINSHQTRISPDFSHLWSMPKSIRRLSNVLVDFPTEMRHFLVFQPKMNDVF